MNKQLEEIASDKAVEARLLRVENAELRKRIADLEAQNLKYAKWLDAIWPAQWEPEEAEAEPTPGFFNAENMDYLHKMMHMNRLNIGKLSERINKLEAMVNMPSDHDNLDVVHHRMNRLADRITMLERAQREGEGEL